MALRRRPGSTLGRWSAPRRIQHPVQRGPPAPDQLRDLDHRVLAAVAQLAGVGELHAERGRTLALSLAGAVRRERAR